MTETAEPMRPVATALREMVLSVHPVAVEVVRVGDRAATYGLGPAKMSEGYVYIQPYTRWINLGFYRGTTLVDPSGLLTGTGAKMRHVKVADANIAGDLRDLVVAALAERQTALAK